MEDSTLENILGFLFGKKALDKAANADKQLPPPAPTAGNDNSNYVLDQIKKSTNIPQQPTPESVPIKKKAPATKGAMDKLQKPPIAY